MKATFDTNILLVTRKAIEIVKRMLQEKTDIKFISSVTGLSTHEILKLKNQN